MVASPCRSTQSIRPDLEPLGLSGGPVVGHEWPSGGVEKGRMTSQQSSDAILVVTPLRASPKGV